MNDCSVKIFFVSLIVSFVVALPILAFIKLNEDLTIQMPVNINLFKEKLAISRHRRKPLLIAFMTTEKYIVSRIQTLLEVLGASENDPRFDIMFFTESLPPNSPFKNDKRFVVMSHVRNAYPPQQKSFEMLKYIGRKLSGKYRWVYRTDDDNYLMVDHLFSFVSSLDDLTLGYIGRQGFGMDFEKKRLGLKGYNFCMGGVGIVMNWILVKRLADFLDLALLQISSSHEDTEIARAVRMHFNMFCTQNDYFDGLFYHSYYGSQGELLKQYKAYLRDDKTFKARAMKKDIKSKSREKFLYKFGPINFHALKQPYMFYYVSKSLFEMDLMTFFLKSAVYEKDAKRLNKDIFVCEENRDNSVVSTFYARNMTVICGNKNVNNYNRVYIFFRNYHIFKTRQKEYVYGINYKDTLFLDNDEVYVNSNYRLVLVVGVDGEFSMDRFEPVLGAVEFSQIVLVNMLSEREKLKFASVVKNIKKKCDSYDGHFHMNSRSKKKFLNCEHIKYIEQDYMLEKNNFEDDEIYLFVNNYYEADKKLHVKCLDLFAFHNKENNIVVVSEKTQDDRIIKGICTDSSVHAKKPKQLYLLESIENTVSEFIRKFPKDRVSKKQKRVKIENFNFIMVQTD